MRILICTFLVVILAFIINGCDSPTGDKPLEITTPSLVYPPNNDSSDVNTTPTFKWSGGADKLEIATNLYFNQVIFSKNVTDSTYTLESGVLHHNAWYYWHAGKTTSGTMYWSGIYGFKTN